LEGLIRAGTIDDRCRVFRDLPKPLLGQRINHGSGASEDMPSLGLSGEIGHHTEREIIPGGERWIAHYLFERRSRSILLLIVGNAERISANEGDAKPQSPSEKFWWLIKGLPVCGETSG